MSEQTQSEQSVRNAVYELLSYRERHVLQRRNAGESVESIASALGISVGRAGHVETQARRKVEQTLCKAVARGDRDANLNPVESKTPLRINEVRASDFIKRAYGLGSELNGPGRYDLGDPVQTELRHIKGWIEMAESDALGSRS